MQSGCSATHSRVGIFLVFVCMPACSLLFLSGEESNALDASVFDAAVATDAVVPDATPPMMMMEYDTPGEFSFETHGWRSRRFRRRNLLPGTGGLRTGNSGWVIGNKWSLVHRWDWR